MWKQFSQEDKGGERAKNRQGKKYSVWIKLRVDLHLIVSFSFSFEAGFLLRNTFALKTEIISGKLFRFLS